MECVRIRTRAWGLELESWTSSEAGLASGRGDQQPKEGPGKGSAQNPGAGLLPFLLSFDILNQDPTVQSRSVSNVDSSSLCLLSAGITGMHTMSDLLETFFPPRDLGWR